MFFVHSRELVVSIECAANFETTRTTGTTPTTASLVRRWRRLSVLLEGKKEQPGRIYCSMGSRTPASALLYLAPPAKLQLLCRYLLDSLVPVSLRPMTGNASCQGGRAPFITPTVAAIKDGRRRRVARFPKRAISGPAARAKVG
ncbi:hypothetical protein C8R45DRAFT_1083432 [Mycena sanguinolenta]|nr:hypothetical protein C8R45DRAFT_1083432 [Mycena sanguinolenta]